MFNFKLILSTLSVALIATSSAHAATIPGDVEARDVFVPHIFTPKAGDTWVSNTRVNVTWDISNIPIRLTNPVGLILLAKDGITQPVVVANGFPIVTGFVEVTVPNMAEDDDYSIILFGDSGNQSEQFTITGSGFSFN